MPVMYCAGDALRAAKTRERARRQIFSKENDRCGGRGRCRGSHAGTTRGRKRGRTPAASVRNDDLKISWEESSRAPARYFYWALGGRSDFDILGPKLLFAERDKHHPSRSRQTSLATAVVNITKPVTKNNFGPSK